MRRTLALSLLVVVALFATNAFAIGEARITGKIIDAATKAPLAEAKITVTATSGKTFKQAYPAKKDGTYAIFLLDGTLKYSFSYEAPGYTAYVETMKLKLGEPNIRDIELNKAGAAQQQQIATEEAKPDPAVAAYNEGAALANAGDDPGAVKKFEEALAAKPDLTAAWTALARVYLRMKNYPKAIEAANKGVEADSEDTDMWSVLFEAYRATGDKAKAAEAKKHMPENPAGLFNEAVPLLNAGKYEEAEPILKKVISADPSFADAYYQLGIVYMQKGNSAEAKRNFQKYLELAPNGKDADVAKEAIKAL
ncbi:MAG TPA: tetratricopeptide repeat protein [Thermoanaerobaculia bacterium]|nr:tetratricopeptide repeat protein [Thermoanaerobaculia bacterium]